VPVLTAVVTLSVACTAGYGILNPQRGRTLQAQIANGARFSSTAVPSAQPAGQPMPWWIEPGRMPFGESLHVKPAKPLRVPGTMVMAIGDSVMLASAPELAQAMPGIYINAKVSRPMYAGISLVDQLARAKRLRQVVIVGLGNQRPCHRQPGQPAQDGGRRPVAGCSINTFVPRSWEHEVNSTLARAASRYPNVLLVNWHSAIEHHQSLLWNDNIHPQPVGGKLYAKVVRKAVLSALGKQPRGARAHATACSGDRLSSARQLRHPVLMAERAAAKRPNYEQARDELAELVKRLEAGGLTLEQSLELWERGEQLAAICEEWLEGARARLAAAIKPRTTTPGATTTRRGRSERPAAEPARQA